MMNSYEDSQEDSVQSPLALPAHNKNDAGEAAERNAE